MDDLSPSELKRAIKLQFSKRCGRLEPVIAHMGDDFITRYSTKAQPNPEFFRQDASAAHQQFTLYADQCILAMRKFALMESPATVMTSLINSMLKINEYLAKQIYHHIKTQPPQQNTSHSEVLCASCCKARQNEKVRVLRDELNLNKSQIYAPRFYREIVTRKGQKYDVEQLLHQQLDNLEELNEDEVRKRLGKLELDHDKRRHEMSVCIEELARANQRVAGYSKIFEKKGKDEANFNIKEYVFQISRHFYHNISSLDQKIKSIKQGLSPMADRAVQTDQTCVSYSEHQDLINRSTVQIFRLKSNVHDLQAELTVEQRKYKEQLDNCVILQEKLKESEVQREQNKIIESIAESQLKSTLAQFQSKTQNLERIVRKLKTTVKVKDSEVDEGQQSMGQRSTTGKPDDKSQCKIQEDVNEAQPTERQQKKQLKGNLTSREFYSSNLNSRLMQKINLIKDQNMGKLSYINELTQSIHKIYSEIQQENKDKLKIQQVFEEMINLQGEKKANSRDKQRRNRERRVSLYNIELKNMRSSCEEKGLLSKNSESDKNNDLESMSRFNRRAMKKIDLRISQLQRLAAIRAKQNLMFGQGDKYGCLKSVQTEGKEFSVFDPQRSKIQFKKNVESVCGKPTFFLQTEPNSRQPHKLLKRQFGGFQFFKKKVKKRRHLSQENSFDQNDEIENFRKSIDKLIARESNIFNDQDTKNLLSLKSSQPQAKPAKKSAIHKQDNHKIILSLQQINYSTYFYSLIAKLHLKSPVIYANFKKAMSRIPGHVGEEDNIKNSLNALIVNHRRCKGGGSICTHLQRFLQKVKNL